MRAAVADAALQRDRRIRERVYQQEQIEDADPPSYRNRKRKLRPLARGSVVVDSELAATAQAESKLKLTQKTSRPSCACGSAEDRMRKS